ncbi:MAG: hypothetical protein IT361_05480 [Gemmatimonadaceae bacterium]|nr:hypothetical protein [Gemmatimonadaceae bacterium]
MRLDAFARLLRAAKRVDSVGRLTGPVDEAIGMIMDVAVDSVGRTFVLDRAFSRIRIFDRSGKPSGFVGQSGAGPLDFRSPMEIWVNAGEVVVADLALGLKRIRFDSRGQPQLHRVIPPDGWAMCQSRGQVISMGTGVRGGDTSAAERLVRVRDSTGRVIRQFGAGYQARQALVRSVMNEGVVACTGGGDVVIALSRLPFVRGFRPDGSEAWVTRLSDFRVGVSRERVNERGQLAIGVDPDNPDGSFTMRARELSAGIVCVQVGLMTLRALTAKTLWERIDTYLIDAASGRSVFVASDLPTIGSVLGRRIYAFQNEPFPMVVILEARATS